MWLRTSLAVPGYLNKVHSNFSTFFGATANLGPHLGAVSCSNFTRRTQAHENDDSRRRFDRGDEILKTHMVLLWGRRLTRPLGVKLCAPSI